MSIDDKLGPISRRLGPIGRAYWHIDEEVHRYYEKIAKRWEEDGHERKALVRGSAMTALTSDLSGAVLVCGEPMFAYAKHNIAVALELYVCMLLPNIAATLRNRRPDGISSDGDRNIISNPVLNQWWSIVRGPRLSTLVTGVAIALVGGMQFAQGLREGDVNQAQYGVGTMALGAATVSASSTIYLMDCEPTLLERAPAWKRGLNAVKKTITPTPAPVPIPVQNYSTTEVDV